MKGGKNVESLRTIPDPIHESPRKINMSKIESKNTLQPRDLTDRNARDGGFTAKIKLNIEAGRQLQNEAQSHATSPH